MDTISNNFDVVIIGGGMVGLSIAFQLIERKKTKNICIIDKENTLGLHSSGRNSGVVHAGIYYKPGSIKAKVCINGAKRLIEWTENKKLPINKCGKVIIPQKKRLDNQIDFLFKRGKENGAEVEIIKEDKLKEIAPSAKSSSGRALWSPNTCVVNPIRIIKSLELELLQKNVTFIKSIKSITFDKEKKAIILDGKLKLNYDFFYNCSGLQADKVAHQFGIAKNFRIIPFKGQYWKLKSGTKIAPNCNIYPVPDLNVPFLGIHFTPNFDNSVVSIGPTANFALGRENYKGFDSIEPIQSLKNLITIGNQYFLNKNGFKKYVHEQALLIIKPLILRSAKELIPNIKNSDIVKSDKVGIRSQLFNLEQKKLEDDFICINGENSTHVLNAISPAFTSSFELADLIIDKSYN